MTSKISFFKLMRDEQKKLSWLTAVMGLVFGLLIPFRVLMAMAITSSQYPSDNVQRAAKLAEKFWSMIGFGQIENTIFILCAGAFCALSAFGYLHSAQKLDFYHSLPLKRETLFAVKALGSILTFVIPYSISQLLGLLAGIPYGISVGKGAAEMLAATGQGILFFLASYGGTLLAVMLTGKMVTSVLAVAVFGGYIPLLYLLVLVMVEVFLHSSLLGEETVTDTVRMLQYSSPWALCGVQSADHIAGQKMALTGYWPEQSGVCILLLMIVTLFLVSLLIYRKRRTERAGSALAFRVMEMPVKLALAIPFTVAAGVIGYEIFRSTIWAFLFMILFGILFCMIMEFIYRSDIRQVTVHKNQMFLSVLTAVLIFCGFRYDMSGYNEYLPTEDEISSMSVCDIYNNYGYRDGENRIGGNYVKTLDYLETDQFEPMYRIAENGVENEKKWKTRENYEYQDYNDCWYTGVKYHLKDGKEIYRKYQIDQDILVENMDEILADDAYRQRYFPVLGMDAEEIQDAFASGGELTKMVQEARRSDDKTEEETLEAAENETESEHSDETKENEQWTDNSSEYVEYYAEFTEKEDLKKLLETYQEELRTVSYKDCFADGINGTLCMTTGEYGEVGLIYPIGPGFPRTMEVCLEQISKMTYTGISYG